MGTDLKQADALRNQLWQHSEFIPSSICIMTNLDLVDWTMQEARQIRPEHRTYSAVDGSFDGLLEALKERLKPNTDDTISQIASAPSIQLADESPTEQSFSEVVVPPEPDIVSNLSALTPAARPADGWVDAEMSNLLKAIVEPDIYTARADRNRAIDLRWVLRDIRSNRLNWSPVSPHDLRMLTIMGLVEMRDDAPVLTTAGFSAIA
jgi:hypothetical protein